MAEIKSTLDLVMERTRNLTFSEEEKQAQKRKEAQKAINGLIQKYLDQVITDEELPGKLTAIEEAYQLGDRSLLVEMILDKIDLEALDGPLPALLEQLGHVNPSGLNDLADTCRRQMTEGRQAYYETALQRLSDHSGIRGSAVLPNLEADLQWQDEIRSRRAQLEKTLLKEKARLKAGANVS